MATRSNRGSRSNRANGRASSGQRCTKRSHTKRSDTRRSDKDLPHFSMIDPEEIEQAIDVYVDAPIVHVEQIKFALDDLTAHLALMAEAGRFVELNVAPQSGSARSSSRSRRRDPGAARARLHNVTAILGASHTTLDRNPELLKSVGRRWATSVAGPTTCSATRATS